MTLWSNTQKFSSGKTIKHSSELQDEAGDDAYIDSADVYQVERILNYINNKFSQSSFIYNLNCFNLLYEPTFLVLNWQVF